MLPHSARLNIQVLVNILTRCAEKVKCLKLGRRKHPILGKKEKDRQHVANITLQHMTNMTLQVNKFAFFRKKEYNCMRG